MDETEQFEKLNVQRLSRLREYLHSNSIDAIFLSTPESVQYATGHRSLNSSLFPTVALGALVTSEEAVLIVPAGEVGPAGALMSETVTDIITVGGAYLIGEDGTAVKGICTDLPSAWETASQGRQFDTIALEAQEIHEFLKCSFTTVVDGATEIAKVRAVKLPAEVRLLRTSAQISELAMEAAIAAIEPGVTERDLAKIIARTMVDHGADPRFLVVATGGNSFHSDAFPTDAECAEGDIVRFDIGCVYEGYWSDIARTAVIGDATPETRRIYQAMLAGVQAQFRIAAHGVRANDVFAEGIRAVEEAGGPQPYMRHHLGHTIGLSIYEQPLITALDERELLEGMVFCFETPYYEASWGGVIVEDTGVVTAEGFELFTTIDRELRQV